MRTLGDIYADRLQAEADMDEAKLRCEKFEREAQEWLIAYRIADPHPWCGRRVERIRGTPANHARQNGTVMLRTEFSGWPYKGYSPAPGSYYVLSEGGRQAYPFPAMDGSPKWTLVA